jgi:hypothetical protein
VSRYRGFSTYMEFERGFHGWLVFFFVTACLGLAARGFILFQAGQMLLLVIGQAHGIVIASSVVRLLLNAALFLAALQGIRLFLHEDPRTPTFWAALFLVSMLAALANYSLIALQATYYEDTTFGAALRESLWDRGLRGMVVYLAWALYWIRSKRVRFTYGRNAFETPPNACELAR